MAELLRDTFFGSDPGQIMPGDVGFHDTKATSEFVQFYKNKVTDKDHCRIVFPGNKQSVWDQPVREVDQRRFARQWQWYNEGKDQFQGQTMLENWGDMDTGSIEIYRQFHIRTVEQLAQIPDGNMSNFPAGHANLARRHRELALGFIDEKKQSAGYNHAISIAEQSQKTAEAAMDEIRMLREENAALKADKPEEPVTYPEHAGGPWYHLSDGTRIKGKDAAVAAEQALTEG